MSVTTITAIVLIAFLVMLAAIILNVLRKMDKKILHYVTVHAAPAPRFAFPSWIDPVSEVQSQTANTRTGLLDFEDAVRGSFEATSGREIRS